MDAINKTLDKRGVSSILSIILILAMVTVASGFITIIQRATIKSEVQGIMDAAGPIALREEVNQDLWLQNEVAEIENPAAVETRFRDMLRKNINIGGAITRYEIANFRFLDSTSPYLRSLGIPDDERHQFFVDATVIIYVQKTPGIEFVGETAWHFYNIFSQSAEDSDITVTASPGDNENVIFVRSVSRLVLR